MEELLAEGKSLGEIQNTIQMRKPYYIQQAQEEEERKKAEAQKELEELLQNPLKDPTQELIDEYANKAEQAAREEEAKANATRLAAI